MATSPCTTSPDIRTDFAPRSGWARSRCAGRCTIPGGARGAESADRALPRSAARGADSSRFGWEILFAIENAEIAAARGEQTHIAGCAYRALACVAQTLFALNERYLINEKGALHEAAGFRRTLADLNDRVTGIWRAIGETEFDAALSLLRGLEQELQALA